MYSFDEAGNTEPNADEANDDDEDEDDEEDEDEEEDEPVDCCSVLARVAAAERRIPLLRGWTFSAGVALKGIGD